MKKYSVCAQLTYEYTFETFDDDTPEEVVSEADSYDPLWSGIYQLIVEHKNVPSYLCQTVSIVDDETGEVIWTA